MSSTMRVPFSPQVYKVNVEVSVLVPLYLSRVRAGFPSPADDYIDQELAVTRHLIKNPLATFIVMGRPQLHAVLIVASGNALLGILLELIIHPHLDLRTKLNSQYFRTSLSALFGGSQ